MIRRINFFSYFYKPEKFLRKQCGDTTNITMIKLVRSTVLIFLMLAFFSAALDAQQKADKGYAVGKDGRLAIADSLLPNYLLKYGAAGAFRKGFSISDAGYAALDKLVAIPVLVGIGISREQSESMFLRSLRFNLSGFDPEGAYQNPQGGGNIMISPLVRDILGKNFSGIAKLYDAQLKLGNVLVVEASSMFPLMIQGGSYAPGLDLGAEQGHYYSALYGWAAAYPWFYYGLSNVALRQALASRNVKLVSLFGQNRFALSEQVFSYLIESRTLISPLP